MKKRFIRIILPALCLIQILPLLLSCGDSGSQAEPKSPGTERGEQNEPAETAAAWIEAYEQFLYAESENNIDGVCLYDVNDDGIPELFLSGGLIRGGANVYTYRNNEVVHIGTTYNSPVYKVPGFKGVYTYGLHGSGFVTSYFYEMVNGKLINDSDGETAGEIAIHYQFSGLADGDPDDGYYMKNEKITEEEYENLVAEYFNESNEIWFYYSYRGEYEDFETMADAMFNDYLKNN